MEFVLYFSISQIIQLFPQYNFLLNTLLFNCKWNKKYKAKYNMETLEKKENKHKGKVNSTKHW